MLTGPEHTKVCKLCLVDKSLVEFYKQEDTKDGYRNVCKSCWNEASLSAYRQNKESINQQRREKYFQNRYGLSNQEVADLKKSANNSCQICKRQLDLVVDHDHSNGKVRGVLCNKCNQGLGSFEDSEKFLSNAIDYLHGENNDEFYG